MAFLGTKDFYLEVQRGNVSGCSAINKFGRNTDIDGGVLADIWDGGNTGDVSLIWVAPTEAKTHTIASSSASDTNGDVGARTVRIHGLTSWGANAVTEDVTMNTGSPPVTSNSYVIIHRMQVLTKGATNVNVGTITATATGNGTITAQISPGQGQTQMAIYGIPSTQKAYLARYYASMNKAAGVGAATGYVDMGLCFNPEPSDELLNFLIKETSGLSLDGSSSFEHLYGGIPKVFAGPGILKVQCLSGTANMDISAGFDLCLIDN